MKKISESRLRRSKSCDRADERAVKLAEYIISKNATVRSAAQAFSVSKSTVHKDITSRLRELDPLLFKKADTVLQRNKAERHLRGGEATKEKYLKCREKSHKRMFDMCEK